MNLLKSANGIECKWLINRSQWTDSDFVLFQDNVRRRRILTWVQQTLPSHNVEDFSFSWNDGIVLCALLEAVHPGICPSFGHLKPHNRVNNCRLGLKLAQQCYGLPLVSCLWGIHLAMFGVKCFIAKTKFHQHFTSTFVL